VKVYQRKFEQDIAKCVDCYFNGYKMAIRRWLTFYLNVLVFNKLLNLTGCRYLAFLLC